MNPNIAHINRLQRNVHLSSYYTKKLKVTQIKTDTMFIHLALLLLSRLYLTQGLPQMDATPFQDPLLDRFFDIQICLWLLRTNQWRDRCDASWQRVNCAFTMICLFCCIVVARPSKIPLTAFHELAQAKKSDLLVFVCRRRTRRFYKSINFCIS